MANSQSKIELVVNGAAGHKNPLLEADILVFKHLDFNEAAYTLAHPTATVAEISHCYCGPMDHLAKGSKVKEVIFVETHVHPIALEQFLQNCLEIHTVRYYKPQDMEDVDFHAYGKAIMRYGKNLKHIEILNEALGGFGTPIGKSFAGLSKLESLEVHLEVIIGHRKNPEGWSDYGQTVSGSVDDYEPIDYQNINKSFGEWNLVELLPHSLNKLTLHIEEPKLVVYYNTYESYGAKLEELFTNTKFSHLTYVEAPRLDAVAAKLGEAYNGWMLEGTHIMKRSMPSNMVVAVDDTVDVTMTEGA